jgi:alpha-L-fucosidase
MKSRLFLSLLPALIVLVIPMQHFNGPKEEQLPGPTDVQYRWHEQERIMFVCLDPCTWQGREYDDHSTPLERINPSMLDTDQWCEVALSWGAREILFVAKHTGGFCWWQTETTDYGIKDTPYKDGKGDVLAELSESCRKYGLNLGIYVYPGDDTWGAGIGSGGRTKDPSKQEAYNQVFRTQLKEVLSNYGDVIEVWFDGSCIIDVSDLLEKHAQNSVIFQGPHASLRWPGTESGKLFYPVWNTVKKEDLLTGVSTQVHSDPDGDMWAPLETNTTLYDHHWFWSPEKEKHRKSMDHIMECYYKSVGYGSVFLLNSTPDTTGLIPEEDVRFYAELGNEIRRRFDTPLAEISDKSGAEIILDFPEATTVNHVVTMEDYRHGHRIRAYRIEGLKDGDWEVLCSGTSVGRKKIDYFDPVRVEALRLVVDMHVGTPLVRSLSAFHVSDFVEPPKAGVSPWSDWQEITTWEITGSSNDMQMNLDLTGRILYPGQYLIQIEADGTDAKIDISEPVLFYDGSKALDEFVNVSGENIQINRTAQVTGESHISIRFTLKSGHSVSGTIRFKPLTIY